MFPDLVEMIADVEAKERKVLLPLSILTSIHSEGVHRWLLSSIRIANASPTTLSTKLRLILVCLSNSTWERVNSMSLFPFSSFLL